MADSTPQGPVAPAVAGPVQRADRLDALRGVAIAWMVGFHLAYDLNLFGWLTPHQQFLSDPFWTTQRTAIVSLFVFCAGLSQSLTAASGRSKGAFWWRWVQIACCAVGVSVATAWLFGPRWVYFGVLHGMAVMLLVTRYGILPWWRPHASAAKKHAMLAGLAVFALTAQGWARQPLFDAPMWHPLGLSTHLPATEDYVPLLPWLGVLWLGMLAGALGRRWLLGGLPRFGAPLAFLGRWPLTIYMLHQPLLWGVLLLVGHGPAGR